MKNVSPGGEEGKLPSKTIVGQNGPTTNQKNTTAPNKPQTNRSGSKSSILKHNSKSKVTSKSMSNDFVLELLGTDSISDVQLGSWKAITEDDIVLGTSSSNTAQPGKKTVGTELISCVYKLGEDKDGKLQEPHALNPDEDLGRELGSQESSIMSMDGERPATTTVAPVQFEIDLESIDAFRSFKDVDNDLVKKIMKIDLNEAEMMSKTKNFFEEAPVSFMKTEPSTKKTGRATGGTKATNNKTTGSESKKNGKSPISRPGRHRVIVTSEQRRSPSTGPKSPYECDWIDLNGKRKPCKEDGKEFAAYVTTGEYRLLAKKAGFKSKNPKKPGFPEDEGYGLTNYPGFATKVPNPSKTKMAAPIGAPNVPPVIAPPPVVKASGKSVSVQTDFSKFVDRKRTTETQTQVRRVGFDLGNNTVQVYEVDTDELTSSTVLSSKNDNESKCRAVGIKMVPVEELENDSLENNPAHLVLKLEQLRQLDFSKDEDLTTFKQIHGQSVHELQLGILSVAEMSEIVLHTLFKDPYLTHAEKAEALAGDEYFQEFMSARSDREALEKMVKVFASTCNRIMSHLDLADAFQIVTEKQGNYISSAGINRLSILDTFGNLEDSSCDDHHFELCLTGTVHGDKGISSSGGQFGQDDKRNEYAMTLLHGKSGQLLQHIYFRNMQFSLVYNENETAVSSLVSANRESFENTPMTPHKLQDIVNRNASYVQGRLTSSKFYMSRVIEELGILVQSFLVGKYLKPLLPLAKTSPKFKVKLQSINVYAGVIYQLAVGLTTACKKFQSSLSKTMFLDVVSGGRSTDTFIGPRNQIGHPDDLHIETTVPVKEAMEDFALVIREIDSTLVTGKQSLVSLARGVRIKAKNIKVINLMIDGVQQLQFGHRIDFGTVMIGLFCCAGMGVDGVVSPENVVTLQKLHAGVTELVKYTKKIGLLSSFLTSKTLFKIRSLQKEEQKRGQLAGVVPFLNRLFKRPQCQRQPTKMKPSIQPQHVQEKVKEIEVDSDSPVPIPETDQFISALEAPATIETSPVLD